jgi:hypothetical protein
MVTVHVLTGASISIKLLNSKLYILTAEFTGVSWTILDKDDFPISSRHDKRVMYITGFEV